VAAKLAGTQVDVRGEYSDDAKKLLGEVLKRHPNHPGALRSLARIRLLEGDESGGRRMLHRAHRLTGIPEDADLAAAKILEDDGRFREAAELLKIAWRDSEELILERARTLFEAGETRIAVLYADVFLEVRPLDVDGLHLKARGLRKLEEGGEDEAFRLMQLAISLEWLESGNWEEAKKSASRSLRYGEDDGVGRLLIAVASAARGKPFAPPETTILNTALKERLKALAASGTLPPEVRQYIDDL
jgi:tetratricopeptide (TPR) repeat protein